MCQGRGQYINPSIDSHGLSSEDFDRDPDFKDDYLSGVYNMTCELCGGRAVEPEFDEYYNSNAKGMIETRNKFLDMIQSWDAESEMERSMGA